MSDEHIKGQLSELKEDIREVKSALREYLLRVEFAASFAPVRGAVYLLVSVVLVSVCIAVLLLVVHK